MRHGGLLPARPEGAGHARARHPHVLRAQKVSVLAPMSRGAERGLGGEAAAELSGGTNGNSRDQLHAAIFQVLANQKAQTQFH